MRSNDTDLDVFVAQIAQTPRQIVIRSLRRRFWHAFQQQDAVAALRVYQATRVDWEDWMWQQQQQRIAASTSFRKKRSSKLQVDTISPAATDRTSSPLSHQSSSFRDLTKSVGLLQLYMNPTEPFGFDDYASPYDPYPEISGSEFPHSTSLNNNNNNDDDNNKSRRPTTLTPRSALAMFFPARSIKPDLEMEAFSVDTLLLDPRMTTPFHEAARLGCAELVRAMLQHCDININARNGAGRTCLHLVSGGVTVEEATRIEGIGAPQAVVMPLPEPAPVSSPAAKAVQAMGKFIFRKPHKPEPETPKHVVERKVSQERWNELQLDRTDAAVAILSYTHADDGSEDANQGISINSVDRSGRTALHYAAETGRSDICMALLSSFGAMLTIIDDRAKTPCELAADFEYHDLAAQLEARALLYIDPYGMNEELAAATQSRPKLVPPFSWYKTLAVDQVQIERERRTQLCLEKVCKVVAAVSAEQTAQEVVLEIDAEKKPEAPREGGKRGRSKGSQVRPKDDLKLDSNSESVKRTLDGTQAKEELKPSELSESLVLEHKPVALNDMSGFEKLNISHVELFLTFHAWDLQQAVLEVAKDPVAAFEEAGVALPPKAQSHAKEQEERMCPICLDEIENDAAVKWRTLTGCEHSFCTNCLGDYITECARSKSHGGIMICPHHVCSSPLSPVEVAELTTTGDVYEMLLDTANRNFVVTATDMRFCPYAGCDGIVQFNAPSSVQANGIDRSYLNTVGAVCTACGESSGDGNVRTYEGVLDADYTNAQSSVVPRRAHRFCFACGEPGLHWPVRCDRLEEWKATMKRQVYDVEIAEGRKDDDYNDVAQKLWLKTNTRPCPKCKAPIEKNEGCNHMTCSNPHCKYEFCWICRNDWKLHNTETGGFFRCNRWVEQKEHEFYDAPPPEGEPRRSGRQEDLTDPATMLITYGTAMHAARVAMRKSKEMDRFLHHYRRWCAHAESAALERKMSDSVGSRLQHVVDAAIEFDGRPSFNFGGEGLSFIHDAFTELLECRSMLQHSYAFSYFRYNIIEVKRFRMVRKRLSEKVAFEQVQSELEMMTEQMSDVVARSHLRATQSQIKFLTVVASEKRKEFSNVMIGILVAEQQEEEEETEGSGKEKKSRSQRRLIPGLLDDIVAVARDVPTLTGTPNEVDESSEETARPLSQAEDNDMEEAIRASLEAFVATMDHQEMVDESDRMMEELTSDWACSACTYMNSGGRRCAMCGTGR